MDRPYRRLHWHLLVVLGLALCLVALLLHPAAVHNTPPATFILLPVLLFGLVLVPRSLWPSTDLNQRFAAPVHCRSDLFQRPPPSPKN
jgi:hypothetical protein